MRNYIRENTISIMFIDYKWEANTATAYPCWEDTGMVISCSDELDAAYRKNLYTGINRLFSLPNVVYSTATGKVPFVEGGSKRTKVHSLILYKNWTTEYTNHGLLTVITDIRVCSYKRQLVMQVFHVNQQTDRAQSISSAIQSAERVHMIDSILKEIA